MDGGLWTGATTSATGCARSALRRFVIAGAEDVATPGDAALIAERIPSARLVVIPGAAHLANVEQPAAFAAAVLEHLAL